MSLLVSLSLEISTWNTSCYIIFFQYRFELYLIDETFKL